MITLTPQQEKILILYAEGLPTRLIARRLQIAESTVYAQRDRIKHQTGLEEITLWVHFALNKKWIHVKTWDELGIFPTDPSDKGLFEQKKGDIVQK